MGLVLSREWGLAPSGVTPSPAVPCRQRLPANLKGGSGISSDIVESCIPVKESSCTFTVPRASAPCLARGHDHTPGAVPAPGSCGRPCLCQGASEF